MALKIDCETNCAVISSSCTTRLYKNKFTNILKWKIDGEAFSEERAVIVQCVCGGVGGGKEWRHRDWKLQMVGCVSFCVAEQKERTRPSVGKSLTCTER